MSLSWGVNLHSDDLTQDKSNHCSHWPGTWYNSGT